MYKSNQENTHIYTIHQIHTCGWNREGKVMECKDKLDDSFWTEQKELYFFKSISIEIYLLRCNSIFFCLFLHFLLETLKQILELFPNKSIWDSLVNNLSILHLSFFFFFFCEFYYNTSISLCIPFLCTVFDQLPPEQFCTQKIIRRLFFFLR